MSLPRYLSRSRRGAGAGANCADSVMVASVLSQSTSYRSTGSERPFTPIGQRWRAPEVTSVDAVSIAGPLVRICPALASSARRAATLTESPNTSPSRSTAAP